MEFGFVEGGQPRIPRECVQPELTFWLWSGYNIARLRYEILLAPEAAADIKRLKANLRVEVRDAIGKHLRHEPGKTSRSRIKRLRGVSHPQYRIRIGELRVFYDISEDVVEVLAIVPKSAASEWLDTWSKEEQ